MRYLLAHNGQDCDITVIEGVMGYYDGLGLTSTRASTYEAARETESPVVLVVNARGAALSVLAAAEGFLRFAPDSGIRGVILNGCSAMSYEPAGAGAGKPSGRPRLRLPAPSAGVCVGEPPLGAHHRG
ncbi:MAG: hypothetical protein ACLR54_00290 [Oscillospiraceae bacterium]